VRLGCLAIGVVQRLLVGVRRNIKQIVKCSHWLSFRTPACKECFK
jgi:hypothetical protein